MRLSDRYIARQVLVGTLYAIVVLSLVLVMGNLFKQVRPLLVEQQAPPGLVFRFILKVLANHGLVAAGSTVAHAMKVLQEVESLCQIYLQALAVGEPVLLSALDMATVLEKFRSYGRAARV